MKLHSIIMSQVTEYSISMKIGLSETSMGLQYQYQFIWEQL